MVFMTLIKNMMLFQQFFMNARLKSTLVACTVNYTYFHISRRKGGLMK